MSNKNTTKNSAGLAESLKKGMRLDRFISQSTGYSRKETSKICRSGLVSVNDTIEKSTATLVYPNDRIELDGELIEAPMPRYFMYHKPPGLICANKDKLHPTVIDEFFNEPKFQELQCVGRLDIDTTGLLLVTDDGQWNHRISHPNYQCKKHYYADIEGDLPDNAEQKCAVGIFLQKEKKRTEPAELQRLSDHEINLIIQEGRYHQVKRMVHTLGCEVLALHRYQIGELALDEDLPEGHYRALSEAEINLF